MDLHAVSGMRLLIRNYKTIGLLQTKPKPITEYKFYFFLYSKFLEKKTNNFPVKIFTPASPDNGGRQKVLEISWESEGIWFCFLSSPI